MSIRSKNQRGTTPMATLAQTSVRDRRHDERGEIRHLRLLARHRLRMVRLLSLCDARAVLRRAVLPARQRHGRTAVGLRHLRGGLPGAPVRRADLRPHRRPGRPQIHLPRHHRGHGQRHLPGRPAADLRADRLGRADPAGDAAAVPGPRARRRIRRRGDLCRRALAARTNAATPRASSRPRPRSASSWRWS